MTSNTKSEFQFHKAVRENVRLLIGLAGASGSGKTYSGMRLAKGLCGDKPFAVIDTENGRASMYADAFNFDVCRLHAPYRPEHYTSAIETADNAGYGAILIDSMSHEHAGEGGVLDWQEEELDLLVNRARERGDKRKDWELEEAYKRTSWIEPKRSHKRMVEKMNHCNAHLIICMRAEDKIDFKKNDKGKTVAVPMETLPGFKGWIPICDKKFLFELTASFILVPDQPGILQPIKLQEQHKAFFPLGKPVTEESARLIGEWAKGGTPQVETKPAAYSGIVTASEGNTLRPPITETKPGVYEPASQTPETTPMEWFQRLESAPTIEALKVFGVELGKSTLGADDLKMARQLYAARMKFLKSPQPPGLPDGGSTRGALGKSEPPPVAGTSEEPWI